jgi:hypothetical protein
MVDTTNFTFPSPHAKDQGIAGMVVAIFTYLTWKRGIR